MTTKEIQSMQKINVTMSALCDAPMTRVRRFVATLLLLLCIPISGMADVLSKQSNITSVYGGVISVSPHIDKVIPYPFSNSTAINLCRSNMPWGDWDIVQSIEVVDQAGAPVVKITCKASDGFPSDPQSTVFATASRCPSGTAGYAGYAFSPDDNATSYAQFTNLQGVGPGFWCAAPCSKADTLFGQCKRNSNLGQQCPSTKNPISIGLGNKFAKEVDYVGGGLSALQFARYYNSRAASVAYMASQTIPWRHEYERRVDVMQMQTSLITLISVDRADGRSVVYNEVNGSIYPVQADNKDRLDKLTDGNGLVGWRFTEAGTDTVELYDANGVLQSITLRSGVALAMTYSSDQTPANVAPRSGLLIAVTDSFGKSLQFTYNSLSRLVTMTDPAGGLYSYAYGNASNSKLITSVTYPDLKTRTYLYNEAGLVSGSAYGMTGILDESNTRYATYKYDAQGRAYYEEHGGGIADATTLSFGANSTTVTDALNTARTYSFQDVLDIPRSAGQSQPGGSGCGPASQAASFDANGNVGSRLDFNNVSTTYGFDLTRNLETSRTEAAATPKARTITTQWHPTFQLPTQIDEPGRRTTYAHDPNGNVLTVTVLDTALNVARTTNYAYNSFGQILTIDGPRTDVNDTTTYTYYTCTTGFECGQLHTISNALSQTTTFNTYNAHGQPLTITDANGVVTTLTYDARQRLTSRTVAGETTVFDYWPTGLLKKVTLPDLSYFGYSYDNAHRLTEIQDSEGNRIVYTLDAAGNRKKEEFFDASNALTQTRSQTFDALSRLYQSIGAANTASVTTTFGYDANGNATTVNAPLGRNSSNQYDELNRLKQSTDPMSGNTTYGYNALDQLISVSDPRSLATAYIYNALGDLTQQISPDTGTTTNTFDTAGNLKTTTDARNLTATYTYDALNRVTQMSVPDQTIGYTYDAGANGVGRLSSVSDNSGSTSWTYTPQGRIDSKSQVMGGMTKTATYGYNSAGQLTSFLTPSGKTITYTYANNRISGIQVNGIPMVSNVLYEPFGPTSGWTWGTGSLAVRVFDTDGKVTFIDSAGQNTYQYDDAFRITGISDTQNSANSLTFGYDNNDRLTSGSKTSQSQTFTYDANGNRQTQGGAQSSAFTNSTVSNRLDSVSGALTRTYQYDNAGNTTSTGSITYAYNNAGRMISSNNAGLVTAYSYNALGQRVKKSNPSGTTYFFYDEAGHLLGEYDQAGNLIEEIVWLGDTPVATIRWGSCGMAIFYIHTDHLNTPRRITKRSTTDIVWRWDSDAFGSTPANENPSGIGTFAFNLRFPGQYFDSETGLLYNWNRYYDQQSGRYISSDPIGLNGGMNTYAYAAGNPITKFDINGLAVVIADPGPRHAAAVATLARLRRQIEATALCCSKPNMDTLLSRFDSWKVILANAPMPRGSQGREQGLTHGRLNETYIYSDAGSSLELYAHEYAHTIPDNVNMTENNSWEFALDWDQKSFEKHANAIEDRIMRGLSFCDLITGAPLQADPYRSDPRPSHPWYWYLNPFN